VTERPLSRHDRCLPVRSAAGLLLFCLAACDKIPSTPSIPLPPSSTAPLVCGVERWPVKTLSDLDAAMVGLEPVTTSISLLNGLPAHCDGGPDGRRAYPEERQTFEVSGRVLLVRTEDDRDVHIALADPDDPRQTMVVEVADPGCSGAVASLFRAALVTARESFQLWAAGRAYASLRGELVRVRGVGFFDFDHGQTGRSRSCVELHPVLGITPSRGP
jgi:hypothetical protein